MKQYTITLPTEADDIWQIDGNEFYIWFKELDLSIDLYYYGGGADITKIWITGNSDFEPSQVPFLMDWAKEMVEKYLNVIEEKFNNN